MYVHMIETSPAIPIVEHIAPIGAERRAWLVDIWGVMHNGVAPFTGAVEACQTFRRQGGLIVLVSNAPRPHHSVAEQLDRIGVPRDAYDAIVSSGDASKKLIHDLGPVPVYHLGPSRDLTLYDGFQGTRTSEPAEAKAVVCTGLFDDETETPADYHQLLTDFAGRGLEMVCVNPDVQVERGGQLVYCAGALAQAFERMGGTVHYSGKPYLPIYTMTVELIGAKLGQPIGLSQMLAIGDGVHTDIAGAARAGIDAVFVASRVHVGNGRLDDNALAQLFPRNAPVAPIAAMTELRW